MKVILLSLSVLMGSLSASTIKTPLDSVEIMGHKMSEMRHMLESFAMIDSGVDFRLPKDQLC